jgi:primase-polymerase (primpol)-like protein
MQAVPYGLEHISQFIAWRTDARGEKLPCDHTGAVINAHDPAKHLGAEQLANRLAGTPYGMALALRPDDPLFFIDLDHVYNPATGVWSPLACDVLGLFNGAAVELSASGTGVHIIACGAGAVPPNHQCRITPNLEFYTHGRFVALTGVGRQGNATLDMSAQLHEFMRRYQVGVQDVSPLTAGASVGYEGPGDDSALIQAMCNSPGSFHMVYGDRCHPRALWVGEVQEIAKHYPASGDHARLDGLPYDASAADLALCGHLAFWTGRDAARIERLWLASALGQRPKVQGRAEYRRGTITRACAGRTAIYDKDFRRKLTASIGDDEKTVDIRPLILTLDEMRNKLWYIESTAEVVHEDMGRPRSWANALGAFAGSTHQYETTDGKIKEAPALSLWRRDPARKSVDVLTWAPGRGQPCLPPESHSGNSRAFNVWLGLTEYVVPPDADERVKPFLEHVAYLVPDAIQRRRFMQWLGHILQRPDVLPHTCYLMITPQTGVGRNWLASVLARVLRGYVASSVKIGQILEGGFNGVLSQKLLAVVDEAREGMSEKKYVKAQAFKELITQETRTINPKYGFQTTEYNCMRWLMFSNHLDALPLDSMDRRVEVIRNPDDRRSPETYQSLYTLIHDYRFIASVYHYLHTLDLTGFDAGAVAQMSEIKNQAIESTTSLAEQLAKEFASEYSGNVATIAQVRQFINAGMDDAISDRALAHAIDNSGMKRVNKRRKFNGQRLNLVCVRNISPKEALTCDLTGMFGIID